MKDPDGYKRKFFGYGKYKQPEMNRYILDEVGQMPTLYGGWLMLGPFYLHFKKGLWWFRIFGYGLHWKNISKRRFLLFSDRNRLGKNVLFIGNWKFKLLKP